MDLAFHDHSNCTGLSKRLLAYRKIESSITMQEFELGKDPTR